MGMKTIMKHSGFELITVCLGTFALSDMNFVYGHRGWNWRSLPVMWKKKKVVKYLTGPVCGPKEWKQEIKKILQGFDFCMYPKNSLEINDVEV